MTTCYTSVQRVKMNLYGVDDYAVKKELYDVNSVELVIKKVIPIHKSFNIDGNRNGWIFENKFFKTLTEIKTYLTKEKGGK